MNKFLICDGSNLLHKAKYANTGIKPCWKFFSYIFLGSFLNAVKKYQIKKAIVCWDKSGSTRRKIIFPEHKQYEPIDEMTQEGLYMKAALIEYGKARKWLQSALARMGFMTLLSKGIEADDIAYWLVHYKLPEDAEGVLLTEDKDWKQTLKEGWKIDRPLQKEIITFEDFKTEYQIDDFDLHRTYIHCKAMSGKKNEIPGIEGIGEVFAKRITKLILSGKKLNPKLVTHKKVQEAIDNGKLSTYLELTDYTLLTREERRLLHIEYENQIKNFDNSLNMFEWIDLANEIDSENTKNFGEYLNW